MKSMKAMGKTKNKSSVGPADSAEQTKAMRSPVIKMAMQDRAIEFIKSGNIEGLQAMTAEGATGVNFVNKLHTKSGMHPLAVAADESNLQALELLIKVGAEVNLKDKHGRSALLYSAGQLYDAIIDVLVQSGADVNDINSNTGETAAHVAARHKFNDIVQVLDARSVPIDTKDHRDETPLTIALKLENFPLCDYLLSRGADINSASSFGDTPLLRCGFDGRVGTANYILEHGGDLRHRNQNGETALLLACRHGNQPIVEALLRHGADVNEADNMGRTALVVAVMAGKRSLVQRLLQCDGVEVAAADNWGFCALACACMVPEIDLSLLHDLLRAPGVLVNQQDRSFDTPLMHAARRVHGDDLRPLFMLLECDADPLLTNIQNRVVEDELPPGPVRAAFVDQLQRYGLAGQPRKQGDKPQWVMHVQRHRHHIQ